uniref:Uncharacterized protein n=1 Tax=Leersia perrieri TaxID=77586 RepID=A0A0D9XJ59_9ORYZ
MQVRECLPSTTKSGARRRQAMADRSQELARGWWLESGQPMRRSGGGHGHAQRLLAMENELEVPPCPVPGLWIDSVKLIVSGRGRSNYSHRFSLLP